MIHDQELSDIHEDLSQVLDKLQPAYFGAGYVPKLVTACMSLASYLDDLNERQGRIVADFREETRKLRADITHLQANFPAPG